MSMDRMETSWQTGCLYNQKSNKHTCFRSKTQKKHCHQQIFQFETTFWYSKFSTKKKRRQAMAFKTGTPPLTIFTSQSLKKKCFSGKQTSLFHPIEPENDGNLEDDATLFQRGPMEYPQVPAVKKSSKGGRSFTPKGGVVWGPQNGLALATASVSKCQSRCVPLQSCRSGSPTFQTNKETNKHPTGRTFVERFDMLVVFRF